MSEEKKLFTIELSEKTVEGLNLITQRKGITVEALLGSLADKAARAAFAAQNADEKLDEVKSRVSAGVAELNVKGREMLAKFQAKRAEYRRRSDEPKQDPEEKQSK
ncbi:MAG: hypothetical protein MR009_00375 [Sutterellaceae bacterium]|nr:hypothetical protein [Sutterellaceae bacterium]MDD7441636.1 hypothetical protein [Sutterellaceae bacterium]MDY2867980.1 hypothetical protein [Mesosutterella sp.]